MSQISDTYYQILAQIESNNNANAKAKTSSASGLYQFIKSTATGLGLPWGNDSSKPFGGASVSIGQQNAAIKTLTQQNAGVLQRAGAAINNATLYAAHFLGAANAAKIFAGGVNADTPIDQVTTAAQRAANPGVFKNIKTVGDFGNWLEKKTGTNPFAVAPLKT